MVCPHPCTCGKNELCTDKVSDYIIIIMNTVYTRMYVHHVISSFEYSIMATTCSTCSTSNVGDRSIVVFSKVILYIQLSHYSSDS